MDRLRALFVFKAVAENRSFVGAATTLNISCAAASRTIAELEALLGARLLHRTTRRVALTCVGEDVLQRASELLRSYDEIESMGRRSATVPSGAIRLAAPAAVGRHYLGSTLAAFRMRCPKVHVELQLCEGSLAGVSDYVDLALCRSEDLRPSLIARHLMSAEVGLYAAPSYLARRGKPSRPSQLAGHECLTSACARTPTTWSFLPIDGGEPVTVDVTSAFQANHVDVLADATLHGAGIAMLPAGLAQCAVNFGQLHRILSGWRIAPIALHLVYASRRNQPLSVRKLIEHLVETLGADEPDESSVRPHAREQPGWVTPRPMHEELAVA